jgi:hypothetical protein
MLDYNLSRTTMMLTIRKTHGGGSQPEMPNPARISSRAGHVS